MRITLAKCFSIPALALTAMLLDISGKYSMNSARHTFVCHQGFATNVFNLRFVPPNWLGFDLGT